MKLSSKGEYAIRAIIDLAYYSKGNAIPITLKDIAKREAISLTYLEQIFFVLKKAGIVKSLRGPGGGYMLNKKTSEIFIGDIIASVESIEISGCLSKKNNKRGCERKSICLAFDMWNVVSSKIKGFLNSISIEDVINEYRLKIDKDIDSKRLQKISFK